MLNLAKDQDILAYFQIFIDYCPNTLEQTLRCRVIIEFDQYIALGSSWSEQAELGCLNHLLRDRDGIA